MKERAGAKSNDPNKGAATIAQNTTPAAPTQLDEVVVKGPTKAQRLTNTVNRIINRPV